MILKILEILCQTRGNGITRREICFGWFDEQGRAYIFFKTDDIMELMDCKSQKATKLVAELNTEKGMGLIERVKQGQGKPARIYLKKFINTYDDMQNSRVSENESADFRNSKCNYNNKNNTNGTSFVVQPIRTFKYGV